MIVSNEVLFFISLVFSLGFVVFLFLFFGRGGLYAFLGLSALLINIEVQKVISLFGLTTTLGNILYGCCFLATDLLSERYGKKETQKAVWTTFWILIANFIFLWIAIHFQEDRHSTQFQETLTSLFNPSVRIIIGSLLAFLSSQLHDAFLFHYLKHKSPRLWVRNILSTGFSQLIDTTIFMFIAFWNTFELKTFMSIFLTTYLFKLMVAIADTPFIYLALFLEKKLKIHSQ